MVPVTLEKSGVRKYSSPSTAPGRVSARAISTSISTNSAGIRNFDRFSMPFCTPPITTASVRPANSP
ncbi:hypothetical protein D3C72_2261000 [compost metagenome]